jgi:hypothetical protein
MSVSRLELTSGFGSTPNVPDAVAASADAAASRRRDTPPRILLATTGALPSTARLALELHDAGARVSLLSPRNHPGHVLDIFENRAIYRAIAPCKSLEAALLRFGADLVIPCDERAVRDLHRLYRETSHRDLRLLINRSIGPAEAFSVVTSRGPARSRAPTRRPGPALGSAAVGPCARRMDGGQSRPVRIEGGRLMVRLRRARHFARQ